MTDRHRWIVDRFEGDLAVVEVDGGAMLDLPRWLLPRGAREDDVLAVTVEADAERAVITLARDSGATQDARNASRATLDRLRARDPGGDVTL